MTNYNTFPSYGAYPSYTPSPYPQVSAQQPTNYSQNTMNCICWVDGEVGAKAQQIPAGWDTSKPFPMWDTNDQVIYLKSFNQMGMPNPLTKLHYTIEESTARQAPMMSGQAALPNGTHEQNSKPDMSDYVRREDLDRMKEELKAIINEKGMKSNGKPSV